MQIKTAHTDKIVASMQRLSDVRFAGQVLFVIIVLMISWSGVKTIETNYGLQKQISKLHQQNRVNALENENLKLQNEYFTSDQYLELSARRNFGLAAPGEKEVIVPTSVAQKYAATLPETAEPEQAAKIQQSGWQKNVNAWIDFFLHRDN